MKVAVFGATGAVGKDVVNGLIKIAPQFPELSEIILFGRRKPEAVTKSNDKLLIRYEELDYEKRKVTKGDLEECEAAICCLGSQMTKYGVEMLQKVDHDYVLQIAQAAKESGVKRFLLCSSGGSNTKSRLGPYLRIKGQAENDCRALNLPFLGIYKPGLLKCAREDTRPAEAVMRAISVCDWAGWWSIKTSEVGLAMALTAVWRPQTEHKVFEEYGMPAIRNIIKAFEAQQKTKSTAEVSAVPSADTVSS